MASDLRADARRTLRSANGTGLRVCDGLVSRWDHEIPLTISSSSDLVCGTLEPRGPRACYASVSRRLDMIGITPRLARPSAHASHLVSSDHIWATGPFLCQRIRSPVPTWAADQQCVLNSKISRSAARTDRHHGTTLSATHVLRHRTGPAPARAISVLRVCGPYHRASLQPSNVSTSDRRRRPSRLRFSHTSPCFGGTENRND
jgi:hypothetical protein